MEGISTKTLIIIAVICYLIGNISSSYILGKKKSNIDIRNHGSGNAGATNTLRVLGKKTALTVFWMDFFKGFLPVLYLKLTYNLDIAILGGIIVVLGHIFPVFLGFKGGKGVATTIGIFLCLFPVIMSISCIVCLIMLYFTRYVSLSSMTVTVLVCLYLIISPHKSTKTGLLASIYPILIIFSHRENIKRIINGTESKVGIK